MDPITRQVALASAGAGKTVDDLFSVDTYSGTGSTNQITNNIDLVNNEGMLLFFNRTTATNRRLFDTIRGRQEAFVPDNAGASYLPGGSASQDLMSFNTDGFTVGSNFGFDLNDSGQNYAAFSFISAPNFFDCVQFTGDGNTSQTISHNLGTTPGMIWVKRDDNTYNWTCYHSGIGNGKALFLNNDSYPTNEPGAWNQTNPTSTQFTVGSDLTVNASGASYSAYLFAEDSNLIKCGSYTGDGSSSHAINVGFEPQWILIKAAPLNFLANWWVFDTTRGIGTGSSDDKGIPLDNGASGEQGLNLLEVTSTGFTLTSGSTATNSNISGANYIYMAIAAP